MNGMENFNSIFLKTYLNKNSLVNATKEFLIYNILILVSFKYY